MPFVAGWGAEGMAAGYPDLLVGYVALVAFYSYFPRERFLHSFAVCSWQAVQLCTVFGRRLLVRGCVHACTASTGSLWVGDVRKRLMGQGLFMSTGWRNEFSLALGLMLGVVLRR